MSDLKKRQEREKVPPSILGHCWDHDFFNNFVEANVPAVNIKESKKEFKLDVSIPGYEKGNINLSVDMNVLSISARKEETSEEKDEDEKVLRQEFTSSSFYRSFTLPKNIDTEKITAKEKSGVLKIVLPKMEKAPEDKKKTIKIG